jgi:putative aldouronate transport system substrate-binding protein
MNEQGLLDPESFIQTNEQYLEKLSTGRVLGIIDAHWNIDKTVDKIKKNNMEHRCFGSFPTSLSEEYSFPLHYPATYASRWGIGITDRCRDPVAAINFFDYLCSDEGQILTHWGIEGIHYNLDSEGERYFSTDQATLREELDFSQKTGIDLYMYPFPEYGRGVLDSTGQPFVPEWKEDVRNGYSEHEKEVLAAYGGEYWADLFPSAELFPVRPYGVAWQIDFPAQSEAQFLFEQCKKIVRAGITEAILTSPDQFDSVWDRMQADLLYNNVEKVEDEFTRLVKERVELWGE